MKNSNIKAPCFIPSFSLDYRAILDKQMDVLKIPVLPSGFLRVVVHGKGINRHAIACVGKVGDDFQCPNPEDFGVKGYYAVRQYHSKLNLTLVYWLVQKG